MKKEFYMIGFDLLNIKINAVMYMLTGFTISSVGSLMKNVPARWIMSIGGLLIMLIAYIFLKLEGNRILKKIKKEKSK